MAFSLPSIPYPPSQDNGYWAPITSTLDWCEENYYATHYVAEIVNTTTNALFIYLSARGVANCLRHGHDRIFLITFLGFGVVGSGSFAFHATLKYPMQLVDELSMIYTTCLMFWATFAHGRARPTQVALGLAAAALAVSITLYYHWLGDPTFHQAAYALLTAVVLARSIYVMEIHLRPAWRAQRGKPPPSSSAASPPSSPAVSRAEQARRDARDAAILRRMWAMIAIGLSVFLGGFAVWSADNAFCASLRRTRRRVGLPWGLLLEGHGWWHLMTGLGAYFYIVWGVWLRHCLNGRQDEFELVWPSVLGSIPRVVRRVEGSKEKTR